MVKFYDEKTFAIDIISDAEKSNDPFLICKKAKEILDVDLTISEIIDYLNHTEDFEKEDYTISVKEMFGEYY